MKKYMIDLPMRLFLVFIALVLWAGIYLTGFDQVHWLLFVPPSFLTFAAVTAICPGLIFTKLACRVNPQS